ncbi:hypothetical protein L6452_00977 [Arctium lappa]|uniref:Uncharacterized protein n=1 Tax=Arctium lappa TaxID=4217 RepID=A0ACB9FGE8_ARCLA|nr:hypothetical protein L6452_00977 [Arctium lappa]
MIFVQKDLAENVEGNGIARVNRIQTKDTEGEAEIATHVGDVRIHVDDLSIDDTTPISDTIPMKDEEPENETATQVDTIQTEDVQQKTGANDEDVSMQSIMVIMQSIMTRDVQTELERDTQFLEDENVFQTCDDLVNKQMAEKKTDDMIKSTFCDSSVWLLDSNPWDPSFWNMFERIVVEYDFLVWVYGGDFEIEFGSESCGVGGGGDEVEFGDFEGGD